MSQTKMVLDLLQKLDVAAIWQGGFQLGQGRGFIAPPFIVWKGKVVSYSETRVQLWRDFFRTLQEKSNRVRVSDVST